MAQPVGSLNQSMPTRRDRNHEVIHLQIVRSAIVIQRRLVTNSQTQTVVNLVTQREADQCHIRPGRCRTGDGRIPGTGIGSVDRAPELGRKVSG